MRRLSLRLAVSRLRAQRLPEKRLETKRLGARLAIALLLATLALSSCATYQEKVFVDKDSRFGFVYPKEYDLVDYRYLPASQRVPSDYEVPGLSFEPAACVRGPGTKGFVVLVAGAKPSVAGLAELQIARRGVKYGHRKFVQGRLAPNPLDQYYTVYDGRLYLLVFFEQRPNISALAPQVLDSLALGDEDVALLKARQEREAPGFGSGMLTGLTLPFAFALRLVTGGSGELYYTDNYAWGGVVGFALLIGAFFALVKAVRALKDRR
jgi:hypothetical protein